jgi:hypothetical protein
MEGIMNSDNSSRDLRSVWQRQDTSSPALPIDELRMASAKFSRKVFLRNIREYVAAVIVVAGYSYYIAKFHNLTVRIGSVMVIAAALWVTYRIYKKGSAAKMKDEIDGQSCIDFHRSELMRQHDLLATVWSWYLLPFTPGLVVFLIGLTQIALSRPGARQHLGSMAIGYGIVFAACAGVFILLGWLNKRAARKLQEQIGALDALRYPPG